MGLNTTVAPLLEIRYVGSRLDNDLKPRVCYDTSGAIYASSVVFVRAATKWRGGHESQREM